VRLLTIGATRTGGFLDGLVADFEKTSGYTVNVTNAGPDIFDQARRSEADLVMVHLGFSPAAGLRSAAGGTLARHVFSNAVAFLTPPGGPAGVGDAVAPVEAFELIAEHEAPFVVNNLARPCTSPTRSGMPPDGPTRGNGSSTWARVARPPCGRRTTRRLHHLRVCTCS
jgi:ABC-type tungstate transport system permease subunit